MDNYFGTKFVVFFLIAIAGIITCLNILSLSVNGAVIFLSICATCLIVFFYIYQKIEVGASTFIVLLIITSLLIKILFVIAMKTQPISDFELLYNTAREVASGNVFTLHTNEYFYDWAYQTGFVTWMSFFIKFFSAGITFFKITNCIFSTGLTVLVYLIAKKFASEISAQFVAVLYMFFPAAYFSLPVLTNQFMSAFLLILSVFIYIKQIQSEDGAFYADFRIMGVALAGAVASIGNIIRPIGVVAVAAVVVLACISFIPIVINNIKKGYTPLSHTKYVIVKLVVFLTAYFIVSFSASEIVKVSNLNPNGLSNNFPEWKFVLGLNETSHGMYNEKDVSTLFTISNIEKRRLLADKMIRDRLSVPLLTFLRNIYSKNMIMWGGFDDTNTAFGYLQGATLNIYIFKVNFDDLNDFMKRTALGYYACIFALVCIGAIAMLRLKNIHRLYIVLVCMAILYFGVHIFIEIQPRYRDFMVDTIFPLAAITFDFVRKNLIKLQ